MRRTLAAAALAAAALGTTAPAASACYGARDVARVCWDGWNPDPRLTTRELACVYTGGPTCHPVNGLWVTINPDTTAPDVCVGRGC